MFCYGEKKKSKGNACDVYTTTQLLQVAVACPVRADCPFPSKILCADILAQDFLEILVSTFPTRMEIASDCPCVG